MILSRLAAEPPFRLLSRELVRLFSRNPAIRGRWGVEPYTQYLVGLLAAAELAKSDKVPAITAIEFGVASGRGLLALQAHAQAVEAWSGVTINVVGFDSGSGLPSLVGDYRDHPDYWIKGDFPMDVAALLKKLEAKRSTLRLGPIGATVPRWLAEPHAPIGFLAFDVDLYSSTVDAFQIFGPERKTLRRIACYFDDVDNPISHPWAGEQLAIQEFNTKSTDVKIGPWHGITADKPFPEWPLWNRMRIAHDLRTIEAHALSRKSQVM